MRSFHLLSLVSSVFLFSYSPSQAQQLHKQEVSVWHRHRRDANVVFTYFVDGQGACGVTNGPNDFIVALNAAQYDGGAHCFETITITVGGKTAQAQIMDRCAECAYGGLDFSQGLFGYFAPLSEGELHGTWSYNSDIATSSSTSPVPTASSTPTWNPTTTVTSSSSSEASPSANMTPSTSNIVSSPTAATSSISTSLPQDLQTIAEIDLALVELGTLLQVSFALMT